jgi:hypothetical protein
MKFTKTGEVSSVKNQFPFFGLMWAQQIFVKTSCALKSLFNIISLVFHMAYRSS